MRALHLPELDAHLCYHDLAGREPVCVWLHGLGLAFSADFPTIVCHPRPALYRALLVDLLGFGFSDRPAAFPYTLEGHAATVARLLDHLALGGCRWLLGCRRCHVRYERRADLLRGLLHLACALVCIGFLDPVGHP